MTFSRRNFMQSTACFGVAAAIPQTIWAQSTLSIGATTIDTLSDGNLVLPKGFILGDTPAELADPILAKYGLTGDTFEPDCNVTLMRSGDRVVLFDAGAGSEFMPTAGKLADALDALSVDFADITDVIFTHAHPDHLWGLLDDFGDLTFPNADHHIGQAEFEFWLDPNTVSTIGDSRVTFAVGAKSRLEEIAEQVNFFQDGQEILPGVAARATPGHTPGHMAFEVLSGTESVMIVGDSIVNHHIAFERPTWHSGSDQDPDLAASTRSSLLDQLAHTQARMIGFHLPNGGMGRVERKDDGYFFVSETG